MIIGIKPDILLISFPNLFYDLFNDIIYGHNTSKLRPRYVYWKNSLSAKNCSEMVFTLRNNKFLV